MLEAVEIISLQTWEAGLFPNEMQDGKGLFCHLY